MSKLSSLPFLSYIKDKGGFIYCVRGVPGSDNRIISSLVYIPVEKELAEKIDPKNNIFYAKRIMDNPLDNPRMKGISNKNKRYIKRIKIYENKYEFFIAPKIKDIKKVFLPIPLKNEFKKLDPNTQGFTSLLIAKGIPKSKIYLYGSKSIGLEGINNRIKRDTDTDILIKGLRYLKVIKDLSKNDLFNINFKRQNKKINSSRPLEVADKRKKYILSFISKSLRVDIKFQRDKNDPYNYPRKMKIKVPIEIKGKVLDDSESATMPCCYKIIDNKNKVWIVANSLFRYLGAAYEGDEVKVKGLKTNNSTILLNSSKHYILSIDSKK